MMRYGAAVRCVHRRRDRATIRQRLSCYARKSNSGEEQEQVEFGNGAKSPDTVETGSIKGKISYKEAISQYAPWEYILGGY